MTAHTYRKIPFPRESFLDQYGIAPDGYYGHQPDTHHHVPPEDVQGVDHHWNLHHHVPEFQSEALSWRPAWEPHEPFL